MRLKAAHEQVLLFNYSFISQLVMVDTQTMLGISLEQTYLIHEIIATCDMWGRQALGNEFRTL